MKIKFTLVLALTALLVAGCAAFFSVFGLSQLFAGASLAVIIMASSLEISKVVVVSLLQRYWNKLTKTFRTYLAIAVFVLVCITSAGIYGFLSNAYQKTATKYELSEGQQSALLSKQALFQKSIDDNKAIIATKTKRLDQLSSFRTAQESRLDAGVNNLDRSRARNDIASSNKEIGILNTEIDGINSKITPLTDSVNLYTNKIIELKTLNNGTAEIGPLKYLAGVTGQPMDKVVNWFILLLIFVFDPLAVALVYAANKVSEIDRKKDEQVEEAVRSDVEQTIVDEPIVEPIRLTTEPTEEEHTEEPEHEEPEHEEESFDDEIIPEEHHEEVHEEPQPVQEEVKPVQVEKPRIKLEDIPEVRERMKRGFSKDIPTPSNSIQRIGNNKYLKNNETEKLFFKRTKQ